MKILALKSQKFALSLCSLLLSYQASAQVVLPDRPPAVEINKAGASLPQDSTSQILAAPKNASGGKIGPLSESEVLEASKSSDAKPESLKVSLREGSKEISKEPVKEASKEPNAKGSIDSEKPMVYEVGKNKEINEITVERYDDDEYKYDEKTKQGLGADGSKKTAPSKFIRGNVVEQGGANSETIQYRYIARGGWLIERFQPYLDRVAIEVRKADSSDLWSSYTELTRTFSYMCLLIATDDGSKRMERAVAKSIAIHRESLSRLRLQWDKKPENVAILFEQYMQSTFYEDLNRDAIKIPAGSYAGGQYKSLNETYPEEQSDDSTSPFNAIKEFTKNK